MKDPKEIKVKVEFTEGWEKRFASAAYSLFLRIENKEGQAIETKT